MSCCIEVETIQHIKDTQTDASNNPRDVISEALAVWNYYGSYTSKIHDRIWQDYRYRMIGSCDVNRWVIVLADRLGALAEVYVGRLSMQATVITPYIGGTQTATYGQRTDTGYDEDMPDTPTPDTDPYLYTSGRRKSVKGQEVDTVEGMESSATRLKDYYKDLKDPLDDLMRDISDLWLNRWS